MPDLNYRSDVILYNGPGNKPAWGANYTVTAYRVGAQVSSATTGKSISVRAGHGFNALDRSIIFTAGATAAAINATLRTVTSVTVSGLTLDAGGSDLTVVVGTVLVNLGPDSGVIAPNYDGSDTDTFSDMAGAVQNTQNRVTADATGVYEYWTRSGVVWELIRDTNGVPVAVVKDALVGASLESEGVYNVKDYGAVGDGVTDDTAAFQRVRNLAELRAIANPAFDANANKVGRVYIEIPAGAYLITSAGTFGRTSYTTRTVGITFHGLGPKLSQILYQPSVAGALFQNNDAWQSPTFEGLEFNCNSLTSDFLDSVSSGGAQDYRFIRCIWSGDWRYCFHLSSGSNNNSEWYFENCRWTGDYTVVLYMPAGLSDQELNFWFYSAYAALASGKFISSAKGGSFKFTNCELEMLTTYTVDTYFIELLGTSHSASVTSLEMDGTRFELRDDNSKFLYCEWTHGIIRFCGLDMSSAYNTRTDTVPAVVFIGANAALPEIVWEHCKLIGKHEYHYSANGYLYKRHVTYKNCEFWQYADPDEMLTFTAISGTGNLASRPQIDFQRCSFKEAAAQVDFYAAELSDTNYNMFGTSVGLGAEKCVSLKAAAGGFPVNATISGYIPLGAYITRVRLFSPAGAVAESNDATFTVQTNETTPTVLATVTPDRHLDGFECEERWFFECDSDTKRLLSLVGGANVVNSNLEAVALIYYVG